MLELVKLALRIKSTAYDAEIETLIESARADMRASGIDTPDVAPGGETHEPQTQEAIIMYCKAHFGYEDNASAERFERAYQQRKLMLALSGGGDYAI